MIPADSFGVLSTSSDSFSPAFSATTGWDFATGIGTVNAANLVNNWPTGSPVPNFSLSAAPTSLSITQGDLWRLNNYNDNSRNGFTAVGQFLRSRCRAV